MKKERCVFFHKGHGSFTRQDLATLRRHYAVTDMEPRFKYGAKFVLSQVEVLFLLVREAFRARFIFIWFAGYHSLLPALIFSLFGKPVHLVIGGYDAVSLPEINYGGHRSALSSWCIRASCRLATSILPVSFFAEERLREFLPERVMRKSRVIHNGVDFSHFPLAHAPRTEEVVTISGGSDRQRMRVKGVDFFAEVARKMPATVFTVVGVQGAAADWLASLQIPNLRVLPWVAHAELPALLNRTQVICQFSRYESFGVAVVEGMACGCVPVGCTFTGTGEVISGTAGELISELDVAAGVRAVRRALEKSSPAVRDELRASVLQRFPRERRAVAILEVINAAK